MPNYPSFRRFADAQVPGEASPEFVRLPDGSLVMTGKRPVQIGTMDKLRGMASRIIPSNLFSREEPAVPWWIAQPAQAGSAAPIATSAPPLPKGDAFAEVAKEAAKEEKIASELGDFSRRVLASPELVEGKWFRR